MPLCEAKIYQSHKSQSVPVPYPTMHNSEQKCAYFRSDMNGTLEYIWQVHWGICENTVFPSIKDTKWCNNENSVRRAVEHQFSCLRVSSCSGTIHTIHPYIYTYLLLLISMLWHRQAIFELKGDKLSSSAECRISGAGTDSRSIYCTRTLDEHISDIKMHI